VVIASDLIFLFLVIIVLLNYLLNPEIVRPPGKEGDYQKGVRLDYSSAQREKMDSVKFMDYTI